MMADMSPEAVTQRLRLMDELWELSVKLMNSKEVPTSERPLEETHAQLHDEDKDTSHNKEL